MAVKEKAASEAKVAQPVVVQHLDEIAQYVHSNVGVDLDTMPSTYEESGRYALPVVDTNKKRKISLGDGREKEVTADIGWLNRDQFVYAWLDPETARLPMFSGYRPVTKDCPAAYADGKPIPESYYASKNYISVGGKDILHFAKATYAEGVKEASRRKALNRLEGFTPGARSVSVGDDSTGQSAGGVVTKGFEHQGYEED